MMEEAVYEILRERKAEKREYDLCGASVSSAVIKCPSPCVSCFLYSLKFSSLGPDATLHLGKVHGVD